MNQNRLFYFTRLRLALWYTAVMGVILTSCGFAVYRAMAHAHWLAVDRELNSVAGTLHDSIELRLQQPGRLEPILQELLPDLCAVNSNCIERRSSAQRHIAGVINQEVYYVRLLDNSQRLMAIAGNYPPGLSPVSQQQPWQTLKDDRGQLYHQISLSLHTQDNRSWGYIQIGRSLADLDGHLEVLQWILGLGLPIATLLVGGASWWLAGLAMQPIYLSYKQIQQFTADAAHELRTPLAAIQATVESALLVPRLDERETQNLLQTLARQNRRLAQLVADLLLLSHLDRKGVKMSQQLCCLNDIVSDLVEELAALAIASDIELESEMRSPQPLIVKGDEEQLYRLVSNLIVNAIQYTPTGGKVSVILDRPDEQALVQVRDTGIGMAVEEQQRIFDRFYRVQSDRSRHTGGSGLGLSIALAIAKAHHGRLEVQSILGQGSTFSLRLPLVN